MLEIYNEEVRCLLSPPVKPPDKPRRLEIKMGSGGHMDVPGLHYETVRNTKDVLAAFQTGDRHRSTASTTMNAQSSRSHMVLMVDVTTYTNGGAAVTGRLYLVDLAGSERVNKSGATGQQLKEAQVRVRVRIRVRAEVASYQRW